MFQGLDLVEVSPPYDPAGVTTTLAARLVLDAMGFAMGSKSPKPSVELWWEKAIDVNEKMKQPREWRVIFLHIFATFFFCCSWLRLWKNTTAHFDSMRCSIGTCSCRFVFLKIVGPFLLGTFSQTWVFWNLVSVHPFQLPNDPQYHIIKLCSLEVQDQTKNGL